MDIVAAERDALAKKLQVAAGRFHSEIEDLQDQVQELTTARDDLASKLESLAQVLSVELPQVCFFGKYPSCCYMRRCLGLHESSRCGNLVQEYQAHARSVLYRLYSCMHSLSFLFDSVECILVNAVLLT